MQQVCAGKVKSHQQPFILLENYVYYLRGISGTTLPLFVDGLKHIANMQFMLCSAISAPILPISFRDCYKIAQMVILTRI